MTTTNEHIKNVQGIIEAYSMAVNCGVLTPCIEDEKEMRRMFGLAKVTKEIVAAWQKKTEVKR